MRNPHNEPLSSDIVGKAAAGRPSKEGTLPERKCVLTGRHDTRDDLLRLAISPDGDVLPDVMARAPGRGAWIGVNRQALEIALANGKLKGALARAFKGATLSIPADLADRIETALRRLLTDRLGIELRAGNLLLGT
ncbi:MAG: nucleic-acid-binding protein, partial [Sphingomonadales bacterium 39-62-4]